jgi:hypothetical protein
VDKEEGIDSIASSLRKKKCVLVDILSAGLQMSKRLSHYLFHMTMAQAVTDQRDGA